MITFIGVCTERPATDICYDPHIGGGLVIPSDLEIDAPHCNQCGSELRLLFQTVADAPDHPSLARVVHLMGCPCTVDSIRAFRSQVPLSEVEQSHDDCEARHSQGDFEIGDDEWDSEGWGSGWDDENSEMMQNLADRPLEVEEMAPQYTWPSGITVSAEYPTIAVELLDFASLSGNLVESKVERMSDIGDISEDESEQDGLLAEQEKFGNWVEVMSVEATHVVRAGGEPVFFDESIPTEKPKNCQHCGAPMVYEYQVISTLWSHGNRIGLDVRKLDRILSVVVCTCSQSCNGEYGFFEDSCFVELDQNYDQYDELLS